MEYGFRIEGRFRSAKNREQTKVIEKKLAMALIDILGDDLDLGIEHPLSIALVEFQ